VIDFNEAIQAYVDSGASGRRVGEPAPEEWEEWVRTLFPKHVTLEFAAHHEELWEWAWSLDATSHPRPLVAVWSRDGGKTTSVELATAMLGITERRRYAWYVTETQKKANNNIRNLGALLESAAVERHYPAHADRRLTKYGHSKGWTSERLMTSGGFTVDAIGLDTAQRGLKVEEQRPDLIILDDIDGRHDTLATTARKVQTITQSILPAGSMDCAVIGIQNLVIKDGVFTRLVDGRADWLADRIVSGPHPAIRGLEWEWRAESDDIRRPVIMAGEATWTGQDIDACQRLIWRIGITAFLRECQHRVRELTEGLVIQFRSAENLQEWTDDEIRLALAAGKLRPFGGIDYGYWRFSFLLLAADRAGRIHVLDEVFSQREDLSVRAQLIDAILQRYGIDALHVYGDPANPTDAAELNRALERGWGERNPTWRATAAVKDKGSRRTGPDRINDMLRRRALLVRRGLGGKMQWMLGMNAASSGEPQRGSRLLWEVDNWMYSDPLAGRAQGSDPDDDTADGGDAVAALRYAIMSELKGAEYTKPEPEKSRNVDYGYEDMAEKVKQLHAVHGL